VDIHQKINCILRELMPMGSSGYTHTILGIGQSYGHLLIMSVTLRACVASTGFVLTLVQKLIAHAIQDLQVLTGGIGVQAAEGISLQKVAKAKTDI